MGPSIERRPELLAECKTIGGCPTGEVQLTQGHNLPARFVLHAVGPVYRGGDQGESLILEACYRNALRLAEALEIRTIAFPCISTGVFGYPKEDACDLAVTTVMEWLTQHELRAR